MSKITIGSLTRLPQGALYLYPYGNSWRQRVKHSLNDWPTPSVTETIRYTKGSYILGILADQSDSRHLVPLQAGSRPGQRMADNSLYDDRQRSHEPSNHLIGQDNNNKASVTC